MRKANVMDDVGGSIARLAVSIRDGTSDSFECERGVPLRARLEGVAEAASAGQAAVGLEILCSNLDEFDVPLQATEYAVVQEAGRALDLPESTWATLGRLVAQP